EVRQEKPFSDRVREVASAVEHRFYPAAEKAKDTGEDVTHEASETLKTGKDKAVKEGTHRTKSSKRKR
ncbi:MAG: hypothetical protein ACXVI1_11105, partial [Halobacteriota archaeon]